MRRTGGKLLLDGRSFDQRKARLFQAFFLQNEKEDGEQLEGQRTKFARIYLTHGQNAEIGNAQTERP